MTQVEILAAKILRTERCQRCNGQAYMRIRQSLDLRQTGKLEEVLGVSIAALIPLLEKKGTLTWHIGRRLQKWHLWNKFWASYVASYYQEQKMCRLVNRGSIFFIRLGSLKGLKSHSCNPYLCCSVSNELFWRPQRKDLLTRNVRHMKQLTVAVTYPPFQTSCPVRQDYREKADNL